jgi:type I restriction enzyme S subunit
MVPTWIPEANCADLVVVRPGPQLDPRFLVYYLNSRVARSHVGAYSVGAVQQHFNVGSAESMPIPLPCIEEQRALADVLGAFDAKIDLNLKMSTTLDQLADAAFEDACRSCASSEGGVIVPLQGRLRFAKGRKPPRMESHPGRGLVPVILTGTLRTGDPAGYCIPDRMVTCGLTDVLVSVDGAVGVIGTNLAGVVGSTLSRLDVDLPVGPRFFYRWMRSVGDELERHTIGTSIPHLDKAWLLSQSISIPRDAAALEELLDAVERRIAGLLEESRTAAAARTALAPRLLSGEIRITDAEKVVEEVV